MTIQISKIEKPWNPEPVTARQRCHPLTQFQGFFVPDFNMDNTWVKNFRKIKEWEWYKKPNMAHLFQHLIREANHKNKSWQGISIKRGQLITGLHSLSAETGLTISQIRTCLKNLEKSGELTNKSTNKYRILTICNYEIYQNQNEVIDKQDNKQIASKSQADDKQTSNKQEVKEVKNLKSLPSQEHIKEESLPQVKQHINEIAKQLYEREIFPKAQAFVNKSIKEKRNLRAILHTLSRCMLSKPEDPWAFCMKIIQVEDGNFNEQDSTRS